MVVPRNQQPTAAPQLGAVPKVLQVVAGTPLGSATIKPGTWTITGSMHQPRGVQAATLLADGRVLAAGGCQRTCTTSLNRASAELYDPRTGTWAMTGSMHDPRTEFTMTLLPNGQVLVAGGCRTANCSSFLASAELYNPRTGKWTMTGSMHAPRMSHTATLLSDGQVLVAGGNSENGITADAELYDPRTGRWALTGSMHRARTAFTAVRLLTGEVLVAGGWDINTRRTSAELYNPRTGTWTMTGSLHHPRDYKMGEAAVLLHTGQVLAAGNAGGDTKFTSAELYNPRTGRWTITGSMHQARTAQTTTLLATGEVLVAGGSLNFSGSIGLASAEIYHP